MKRIDHFVPGIRGESKGILPYLRWPIPAGVATAYTIAYTEPGERVLVPYCQGTAEVREILSAGRQAVALHFDPLVALAVRTGLAPPPARELDAAVARLGDSPKQGMPLRRYLLDLYATSCPACSRPAVADYFVWDREQGAPIAKHLRCSGCAWKGRAAVEQEDLERLANLPPREMHYHYVLDRVSPPARGGSLQTRLEYLLELYSPRNLYALAELTRKIEGLFPEGPLHQALKALLADCLDLCSSLAPFPGRISRRRGLRRPGRYVERNVWFAFEDAAESLKLPAGEQIPWLTEALEARLATVGSSRSYVGQGLVRDLERAVSPRSIRLILTSPPPLDSAAWSLSYLWCAWSLGAEAAAPLRPLLMQRTPDPAWYARVMAGSMAALADLLRDDGRLVLVLTGQRPTMIEALVLAADKARLGVMSLAQSGGDYRLELAPSLPQQDLAGTTAAGGDSPDAQIRRTTVQIAAETIKLRGEPVSWPSLHAAIYQNLAQRGVLSMAAAAAGGALWPVDHVAEQVETALDDPTLVRLASAEPPADLWWLAIPEGVDRPLADRVETGAQEVLQGALALTEDDYTARVFARFPGPLAPGVELVATCLRSYGSEPTPGYWQLRPEDLPDARLAERRTIVEHLLTLGRRLGYHAEARMPFDVAWFERGQARAVFTVQWQATVSTALALSEHVAGARPYMVIPGGRAALVSYKLAHNPLWQRTVDDFGWWFIKYRHVRKLVEQPEVDEYTLRTIVGLDPIVEQESAQLPLF